MKKRNIIILSVVLVLGAAALLTLSLLRQRSTFDQDFQIEAANDPELITKIFMADKENNTVLLVHESDSLWMVEDQYVASYPMVKLLLSTLTDMRIRSVVNHAALDNVTKRLAAKSVKVEVYYKDFRINWFGGKFRLFPYEHKEVFYVGHDTQDMLATYMFREGDDTPLIICIPGFRGCLSPRFVVDPYSWRSHSIVNLPVQEIESVELEIPNAQEESFAVRRDGEGFAFYLLHPERRVEGFDTARVAQLLSSFVNLNFDEYAQVVPKAELDTTFTKTPRTVLRVTDTEGVSHELKTYVKYNNPDDLLAMPDTAAYNVFDLNRLYAVLDSRDTVLIQYFVFDNILQPASFFLGRPKTTLAR